MTLTGFLKIPDIDGESQAVDHEGEIDFHGLSWGVSRENAGTHMPGRPRGKTFAAPVELLKYYDAASPYIALAAAQGKSFAEIVIAVRKDSGDAHLDYLVITLKRCLFSAYSLEHLGPQELSPRVRERVAVDFEKINIKYIVQADDHSAGDEHEIEYNFAAGV